MRGRLECRKRGADGVDVAKREEQERVEREKAEQAQIAAREEQERAARVSLDLLAAELTPAQAMQEEEEEERRRIAAMFNPVVSSVASLPLPSVNMMPLPAPNSYGVQWGSLVPTPTLPDWTTAPQSSQDDFFDLVIDSATLLSKIGLVPRLKALVEAAREVC